MAQMTFYFICRASDCPHEGQTRALNVKSTPTETGQDIYHVGEVFCDGGGSPHSVGFVFPDQQEVEFRYARQRGILNTWREDWGL